MKMYDHFDHDLFVQMVREEWVSVNYHPTLPLRIFNYTAAAQYGHVWNSVTRQCRGLIASTDTQEIISRPFEKFFNLGELQDAEIPVGEAMEVYPKMDGSLGILYPSPDTVIGYSIATRGSFSSDQAVHATRLLNAKYPEFQPTAGSTYLFEIIYPQNRIVVDYGSMDDLVLLDVISTASGTSQLEYDHAWKGPRVHALPGLESLEELLKLPQLDNFEGYVVRFESGMRIKVKMDEYVRLHRIITGVSNKTIYEYLRDGRDMKELLERVPDEFHRWVQDVIDSLMTEFYGIYGDAVAAYMEACPPREFASEAEHRKAFAASNQGPLRALAFLLYDHADESRVDAAIWRLIKPAYERPFSGQGEDVA